MKKVLVIGAAGMLGKSITQTLQDFDMIALDRKDVDITCFSKVRYALFKYRPDYVINCAAYTAVDRAEEEVDLAYKINHAAPGMIAGLVQQINATLIHFSTDYVFDGTAKKPYRPDDSINPINVYGNSKWLGEQAIRNSGAKHYIFRISWLYAPHGKNFFRWVLENDLDEMKVVNTQTGSPTSALDVADFVKHVIGNDPHKYGTYHFCNTGSMTWYAFAKAILEKAGLHKKVSPISEFQTAAKRPVYSVMDCTTTEDVFGFDIPSVIKALGLVIEKRI